MNAFAHSQVPNGMKSAVSLETSGSPRRVMECCPHFTLCSAATATGITSPGPGREARGLPGLTRDSQCSSPCSWPRGWDSEHPHRDTPRVSRGDGSAHVWRHAVRYHWEPHVPCSECHSETLRLLSPWSLQKTRLLRRPHCVTWAVSLDM